MAKFKVAMVDYDYASLEPIEREVVRLGGEFVGRRCGEIEEAIRWAGDADGWVVQYLAPVGDRVFRACPKLRVVGRAGVGVDVIDVPAATAHGVVVTNVPSYCEEEVSDHALALLLSCVRRTALYTAAIRSGTWDWKAGRPIRRLRGCTLGLVGLGKIPLALVPKARALGLSVVAYDPYAKADTAKKAGVELVELDALLGQSDFVSIHCPLTEETRGMFGAAAFGKMKPTAFLINTARGGIVDTGALAEAIRSGRLAGAGLDVMPTEPPDASEPLLRLEKVVLSPHVSWYSEESIIDLQARIGRNVALVCAGRKPGAIVNPEVLSRVDLA